MFHGQFGMMLRCWGYILLHGPDGLRRNTEHAIINANYLQALVKNSLHVPYSAKPDGAPRYAMHEFVASAGQLKKTHGVTAKELAKGLLSEGFHAPTVYFPLIVEEALMVEPTETESMETLDRFAESLLRLVDLAEHDPEELRRTPNLRVSHLDETHAARNLNVRWRPGQATNAPAKDAEGTPTV
jgi:glycine dehydrogenase subunit 2